MKKLNVNEFIRTINENIKKTEEEVKKNENKNKTLIIKKNINVNSMKIIYPIESYTNPSKRKKHTNFIELLNIYNNNNNSNKEQELQTIINELEIVFNFYNNKKNKLIKDLENQNKLFLYRFRKNKEIIQIYKIFEIVTDILFYIIEYIKIENPDNFQKDMYYKKISCANQIIQFKEKEEKNMIHRDPELDNIKIFEGILTEEGLNHKIEHNTIIKTMEDNFEIKKDCHLIKNDLLNIFPQIEIKFSENIQMTEELLLLLKKELKDIFEDDDFSIIEINKGSLDVLITLQFLFKKMYIKTKEEIKNITQNSKNFIMKFFNKIKDFAFFGYRKKKPEFVAEYVKNIEDSGKEIIQLFEEKIKGTPVNELTNFYELSKSFSVNDLNELFDQLQVEKNTQEHNQLLKDYSEYYHIFGEFFDKALALSVFEYQLVKIYVVDRNDYEIFKYNKNNCEKMKEKLLFHGTKTEFIVSILKTFIDIEKNSCSKMGKGFYLSDILDVSWIYGTRKRTIPEIGDSFSVLVCDTYFSESQVEYCYTHPQKGKEIVPTNGIRIGKARPKGGFIKEDELNNYEGFIQNEYLISDKIQMIPIYAINLRRIEYLIIWRDNNFDKSNPNNYKNYDRMLKFNEEMQRFAYREINSKIYYVKSTEEGLKLIDRKKYNKIILITNGGNNGKEFIIKAREIIGANTIALVSCFMPKKHLKWVSQLPNTLLSHEIDFFKEFLLSCVLERKNKIIELKNKIENKYQIEFNQFYEDELFKFPNFKTNGKYNELKFNPLYNKYEF